MRSKAALIMAASLGLVSAMTARASVVTLDTVIAGGNDGSVLYTPSGQSTTATAWSTSTSGATGRIIGIGGSTPTRTANVFVMAFRLPTLPTGDAVNSASLSVFLQSIAGAPAYNADLWGIGFRSANTILAGTVTSGTSTSTGDFNDATGTGNPGTATAVQFSDTTDLGAASGITAREKIMDNMLTPTSAATTVASGGDTLNPISTSSSTTAAAALTSYIQEVYADGAASTAGMTAGFSTGWVFLRLSPDTPLNVTGSTTRYNMWTNNDETAQSTGLGADAQGNDVAPQLSIDFEPATASPEPASLSLVTLSVAGLLGRRSRRSV